VLEPVDLAGVTVRRATLNNYLDLQKKGVKIGSRVFIRRSNDVIPEILGVAEHTENSKEVEKPTVCPYCGAAIRENGAFLYCTNLTSCAPQIVAKLVHFASKGAMDIDGFSEKTAELLLNELNVKVFSDLYELTAERMNGLDGFGELKIKNLLNSIDNSKHPTLANFIYALGIKNVGKKAAKQLECAFKSFERVQTATVEEIQNLDDFGEITAKCVVEYFENSSNLEQLQRLFADGVTLKNPEIIDGVFSGRNVVLTGSLQNYKRSEAEKLIQARGGSVSSTVSKAVNLVVAGKEAGSKLDKAKKLNIKIIDESAFARMLEE
jgi:NAD-dependent DNA ligase (contains BRCT domain type II)